MSLKFWCCTTASQGQDGSTPQPTDVVVLSSPDNIAFALRQVLSDEQLQNIITNSFSSAITDIKQQLADELTDQANQTFNTVATRLQDAINAKLSSIPDQTNLVRALLYEKYIEEELI